MRSAIDQNEETRAARSDKTITANKHRMQMPCEIEKFFSKRHHNRYFSRFFDRGGALEIREMQARLAVRA